MNMTLLSELSVEVSISFKLNPLDAVVNRQMGQNVKNKIQGIFYAEGR